MGGFRASLISFIVLSRLQNFPPVDIELVMFFMVSARRRHKGVPVLEKISQRLLRQPEAAFKVLLSFDAETPALAGIPVVERANAIEMAQPAYRRASLNT